MPEICVRAFRYPEDYVETLRLWKSMDKGIRVGASDAPAEIEKKLQRDPDLFLVAELGGQLVGTVIGGFDGRRGMIYHLAVAADYRRSRLGSRLMHEVEVRLRDKGCIRCYLLVRPNNPEAVRFYEQQDWSVLDDVPFVKDLA
jgi:ribosomal protein S18 acetylase RimI-like enzyme